MGLTGAFRRLTSAIALSLLVAMVATPARADIKLAGEQGWNGFLVQATYEPGKTKFGVSFGQTRVDQTDAQKAAGDQSLEKRMSLTFGVYHDLTSWLRLVAEWSWYQLNWCGGASQTGNVVGAGGFFFW